MDIPEAYLWVKISPQGERLKIVSVIIQRGGSIDGTNQHSSYISFGIHIKRGLAKQDGGNG
jgi:hypothetical protein